jgi:tRNA(Arg) A34 adenosine deaminase TadA
MTKVLTHFGLHLPRWTLQWLSRQPPRFADVEARMRTAIVLASENVNQGTGGPFGAAIFEAESGRLVAAGVNLVVSHQSAVLHAEVVAIALAGQALGTHDLAAIGRYELYASTEPCTMCLGASLWSGVRALYCGARDEDARAIGFDEGPKPTDWPGELCRRGVEVSQDVLRAEAVAVLQAYAERGGKIYNGRTGADAN